MTGAASTQPVLTPPADTDPGSLFDRFSQWAVDRGIVLYPHQEEALLEIVSDANVIVATPTGSGKSLVATAALFTGLATGRRAYYTAPIKALVSEKFFDLTDIFGPANVGMITGDSSVNPSAPIICCTAEILASVALRGAGATRAGGLPERSRESHMGQGRSVGAEGSPSRAEEAGATRAGGSPERSRESHMGQGRSVGAEGSPSRVEETGATRAGGSPERSRETHTGEGRSEAGEGSPTRPEEAAHSDPGIVVMDEFHYYGDRQRGWAWQVPLLELPHTQFILMSATLGDVRFFARDLTERTGRTTTLIDGVERPVPLHFSYVVVPLQETLEDLLATGRAPVYIVHFTQQAALERAQALTSITVATRAERDQIAELIGDFRFSPGFGRTLARLVRHGIGVHHAGMLPKYRRLVEKLAQSGLLKVICGTDTLGVGINVPIRTVLFTGLAKYDGHRTRVLSAREFHQIAGRAGRAGFDVAGDVVVLAPEHVIENFKTAAKAALDPKKKKVAKRKAPDGFVGWSEATYDRLVAADPEPLSSHFRVSHSMLLGVLSRPGDAFAGMRRLIETSHDPRNRQLQHMLRALAIGKALLAAGIVIKLDVPDEQGRKYHMTADLQLDFALDQPLSPLALAALDLLDRESPEYALDVVSLIEATLEGPGPVLSAQRFKARGEAVQAMKSDGIEYEERMALLEDVDYPKPLADLVEVAFESYRAGHPWVTEYHPEPKSVVRDLYERAMNFSEYIAFYQLQRSEGVVLRYLADAYRAMRRTVPQDARTEELADLISWLGELVRGVDSSLLDEWEALAHPDPDEIGEAVGIRPPTANRGVTANVRAFTIMVRNALFRRVELVSLGRFDTLGDMDSEGGWDAERWREAVEPYWDEYEDLAVGATARSAALISISQGAAHWSVRQTFDDPAGDRDWGISAEIDVEASDEVGEPVLRIVGVGPMTG